MSTVELGLEIQVNEWTLGSITLEYVDGTTDPIFNINSGFDSNVDRINLDTAFLTIGDTQRFPIYLTAGRMILPFGTSTGVARADTLSIERPLTIEAFEADAQGGSGSSQGGRAAGQAAGGQSARQLLRQASRLRPSPAAADAADPRRADPGRSSSLRER